MVNRVILVGNMTRDAESISTSGKAMSRLRLATNAVWRDAQGALQENSEFHTVVAFGRIAEVCALYCTRGKRVYIEGRLRTRDYEGTDGLRRTTTEIVAETVKLLQRAPETNPKSDSADTQNAVAEPAGTAG